MIHVIREAVLSDVFSIDFENINTKQAFMVLDWRNDLRIRQNMLNANIISIEEHFNFIKSLYNNRKRQYWLVAYKDAYIGVVDFYNITYRPNSSIPRSAWWGYYLNPSILNRGYGILLEEYALRNAFKWYSLDELKCETLVSNDRVWKLHEKYGFGDVVENSVNKTYIQSITIEKFFKLYKEEK